MYSTLPSARSFPVGSVPCAAGLITTPVEQLPYEVRSHRRGPAIATQPPSTRSALADTAIQALHAGPWSDPHPASDLAAEIFGCQWASRRARLEPRSGLCGKKESGGFFLQSFGMLWSALILLSRASPYGPSPAHGPSVGQAQRQSHPSWCRL